MSANDRVRKHRAKLLSEQRCRLEKVRSSPCRTQIDQYNQITNTSRLLNQCLAMFQRSSRLTAAHHEVRDKLTLD
jgi:hypothetical protein